MRASIRSEEGLALPEVLISAIVLVLIAGASLTGLTASKEAGAQERFRSQASALAQQDQARLRSMKISDFANDYTYTRAVVANGTTFTIESKAQFVSDSVSTTSCTEDTSSADYVKIQSTVSWSTLAGRPPVKVASLIAPPAGSTAANRGALRVSVVNRSGAARPGLPVTATGPTSLTGTTGTNGCVIWGNIPDGTYSVTVTAAGSVDKDGIAPVATSADVIAQTTKTVSLQYDTAARINVGFTVDPYGSPSTPVATSSDTAYVFNSNMTQGKFFGTVNTKTTSVAATPLFPFTSAYAVTAGSCQNIYTPTSGAGRASVTLTAGQTQSATVQLFPIYVTAYNGSTTSAGKLSGASVYYTDDLCGGKRIYVTNTAGRPSTTTTGADMPGLPAGRYDVCVVATISGVIRYRLLNDRVANTLTGSTFDAFMTTGTIASSTAALPAACKP